MGVHPDQCSIDSKLKDLTYSQAMELEICLEGLGPIDRSTSSHMISQIREYKRMAESSTWIYTYLREFVPAKDCSDLMASFKDFLGRHMTSLRHKLPSTFSTTLKGFMDRHIKKKLVTRDSDINVILKFCTTHEYDLDFVIGATNEYIAWDRFYLLAAEYLGRRLSIIARIKKSLKRLMPKLARQRKRRYPQHRKS